MTDVRAVLVAPGEPGRVAIREVPGPEPARGEAIVSVNAFSLNLGEVRRIGSAEAGWRPGWDIAGVVSQAAADGSGPKAGTRVVGMLDTAAWAQQVAVPTGSLAELPESVSFAQASTLPVAGLTALRALERGGLLVRRRVLVTGASGGVGHLAIQLARAAGAEVTALVRSEDKARVAGEAGAQHVVTGDVSGAQQFGPFHLILESVGGSDFGTVTGMLAPGGTDVIYGTSAGPELTFEGRQFYLTGGASLYGFILFYEVARNPPAEDLGRLAAMVADGTLRPHIAIEAPWEQIGQVIEEMTARRIAGKAVLHVT